MKENRITTAIFLERKQIISDLKKLTNAKTLKELETAIEVWKEMIKSDILTKNIHSPNWEKRVHEACQKLRLRFSANIINLYAALRRFQAYYCYYQYLNAMQEAQEKNYSLMLEQCPPYFYD